MKRTAKLLIPACALLIGCSGNHPATSEGFHGQSEPRPLVAADGHEPAAPNVIVATVNGKPIDRERLLKPLVESYGLNVLLQLIQLELARQDAAKANLTVTSEDVAAERATIMKGAFPEADPKDYDQLLENLLKQQNITRPQFDIVLETNAILRKVATPLAVGKISDENIKQAFDVMYGATVRIRDIQVSNMSEALEVKKRAMGTATVPPEDFAKLAKQFSKDTRTRDLGGEWPAFSRNTTSVSEAIKDQAFGLKDGEISDAINTEGAIHIIQVIQHKEPKLAKLDEPTKENLRKLLNEKLIQETMKALRNNIAVEAQQPSVLEIRDPVLEVQFKQKLAEHKAQSQQDQDEARNRAMRDAIGLPSTRPATTGPATAPATTHPTGSEARERPPATGSGR